MRTCFVMLLAVVGIAAGGCGKEIGDPCTFNSDCSPNADRTCDISAPDGYCTVPACDLTTCPEEAVCVQFFYGDFENRLCEPAKTAADCAASPDMCCSLDELCSVAGRCVPRSSEVRFCMRACGSDGDCRPGYECRDFARMVAHGGQPVVPAGEIVDDSSPRFCAPAGS